MKKLLGIIVMGLLLSGCTSTKDKIASFQTQSPHDLCIRFLTLPAWNDYHYARSEAIKKRDIDCTPFQAEADAKKKNDDKLWDSGKKALEAVIDLEVRN
tara:strand:+ start:413 stop:709 length:297 start_codon:yes stop_codon:yes gene_type:complete